MSFRALPSLPDLEPGRHLCRSSIVPLMAFLLPASQDIVALLDAAAEALARSAARHRPAGAADRTGRTERL